MSCFRILHFSDLHEAAPLQTCSAFFDKRLIGRLNSCICRHFGRERIRSAVPVFLKERPDLFIFTGDAATCSQPDEFAMALEDLAPLIRSGIPVLYSPGNHDIYVKDRKCRLAFDEFLKALTCGGIEPGSFPLVRDFDGFQVAAINTALATWPWLSCGQVDAETLSFLRGVLTNRENPVLLATHFPVYHTDSLISGLRRKMYGCEKIREMNPDFVLCGHIHKPYCFLQEECCGSVSKYGVYSIVAFENGKFTVTQKRL